MNEISKSINSIEEFRACYEQELKGILEELNKNGVTNIEGVEEVIKLFFDEYYQYLSVELASDTEIIEEHQRIAYILTEKKHFLEGFKEKIPQEFYEKVCQDNKEINEQRHSLTKVLRLNDELYQTRMEEIKECCLKKIFPNLRKMINTLEFVYLRSKYLFVGSIAYNGNLKKLDELLGKREENFKMKKMAEAQMEEIVNKAIADLDDFSLMTNSYIAPSDLFDGFNPYLLKMFCDGLYLDTFDMRLGFSEKIMGKVLGQTTTEEKNIIKITVEDLRGYLTSPINLGNFWKEKIIEQFLELVSGNFHLIITYVPLTILKLFEKYTFDEIEELYKSVNRKRKFRILPKSREKRRIRIFWDIEDAMKKFKRNEEIKKFLSLCPIYNEEIYLKYKKVVDDIEDYNKNPSKITDSNIEQLKSEFLQFLNSIKEYRVELAIEIFGLTREEVEKLSAKELEQKYRNLLDDMVEKANQAKERLATNKQKVMCTHLPKVIKDRIDSIDQIKSYIEKLNRELETIEREIRALGDESLRDNDSISTYRPKDNYELHLWILDRLMHKYAPLMVAKIRENAKEREQALLESDKNIKLNTPFNLISSNNDGIPVIGPIITRELKRGKDS